MVMVLRRSLNLWLSLPYYTRFDTQTKYVNGYITKTPKCL